MRGALNKVSDLMMQPQGHAPPFKIPGERRPRLCIKPHARDLRPRRPEHGGFGTPSMPGHGRAIRKEAASSARTCWRALLPDLNQRANDGATPRPYWRRFATSGYVAAGDDVLRRSFGTTARPTRWRRAVVATGSRDVWRRSDLRGRLSKLAVRDERKDDGGCCKPKCVAKRLRLEARRRLAVEGPARGGREGRSKWPRARDAPLALSWSDLRNAEATGRWWRRGAAYDRHAQDALRTTSPSAARQKPIKAGADHARAAPEHAGEARGLGASRARPTLMMRRRRYRALTKRSATTARRRASSRPAAAASRPTTRSTPRSRSCEGPNRRTSPSASSSRAGTPSRLLMLLKMRGKPRGARRTWASSAPRCSDPSCPSRRRSRRSRPGAWWPTRPSRSPCSLLCGVCSWRLQMRPSPARCRWSRRPVP